jgi:hypothetical protein
MKADVAIGMTESEVQWRTRHRSGHSLVERASCRQPNCANEPLVRTDLYNRLDNSEIDLTGKLKTPTRYNVFYSGIFLVETKRGSSGDGV